MLFLSNVKEIFKFTLFIMTSVLLASILVPVVLAGSPKTCSNPQLSCQNTTSVSDLCCFNAPGGQLVQTQFWDTSIFFALWCLALKNRDWQFSDPSTGPSNSWTIHGLWPDHCDGTYDSNCDTSRAYTNITAILNSYGKTDLLSYMNEYWVDENGDNESFWEHEWGKHGTCISTLKPSCYTGMFLWEFVECYWLHVQRIHRTGGSSGLLSKDGWSLQDAWYLHC